MAPFRSVNLNIVFVPAGVRFVLPAVLVEAVEQYGNKLKAIDATLIPVFENSITSFAVIGRLNYFAPSNARFGRAKTRLISRPASNKRLQKKEQRNQRTRPELNL